MIKSCLFIVPHPDDEINIGGGIFEQLHNSGIDVSVVICSNGDYIPELTTERFKETVKVQQLYKYEHLYFLGYGDEYQDIHIYNLINGETAISHCGRTETYTPKSFEKFLFKRNGVRHTYTRYNYKQDIKKLILDLHSDLIVCTDLDSHPDHRCISLLFDEAMGEILKETNYKPYILKSFAYLGKWHGPIDYFSTFTEPAKSALGEIEDEELCYPYNWNDRLRISISSNNISLCFWKTIFFKALVIYRTQSASYELGGLGLYNFPRLANPENVYWYRSTESIAYHADFEVSSGNAKYLNDFKIYETNNIRAQRLKDAGLYWQPDKQDYQRAIIARFDTNEEIRLIRIYQNPDNAIKRITISSENQYEYSQSLSPNAVLNILLPHSITTSKLKLTITKTYTDNVKISEIEFYKQEPVFPWNNFPFIQFHNSNPQYRNKILCYLSEKFFYSYIYHYKIKSNLRYIQNIMNKQV